MLLRSERGSSAAGAVKASCDRRDNRFSRHKICGAQTACAVPYGFITNVRDRQYIVGRSNQIRNMIEGAFVVLRYIDDDEIRVLDRSDCQCSDIVCRLADNNQIGSAFDGESNLRTYVRAMAD